MWRWLRPIDSKARFIGSMSQSQLKPNLKCSMCSSMDMNAGAAVAAPKVNIGTFATVPCEPYKPTDRPNGMEMERTHAIEKDRRIERSVNEMKG